MKPTYLLFIPEVARYRDLLYRGKLSYNAYRQLLNSRLFPNINRYMNKLEKGTRNIIKRYNIDTIERPTFVFSPISARIHGRTCYIPSHDGPLSTVTRRLAILKAINNNKYNKTKNALINLMTKYYKPKSLFNIKKIRIVK